ncbi:hypothetical protein Ade02nite_37250 [Paractinoplanes deccanensis]|uniref:Putative Flp pilus-assembly TadG-like N-terminal domain-containing protein n=1 Tax=Paractinoplanes deccanensis TaxID=113561 RepID=A0ABQ3Y503_9ACTN|nr:TadE/TadG family type IV pilus assembly protein [Actinoplanes deccanensis]GID75084.1 hypothetical protein Ade02nite_37250 [Actinoplanes deccanensis]
MPRLTSLVPRRRSGDHGAVGVVVALFLSMSVLLGMGAVVIDIGLLYAEREQLQSGADAASWKVAQSCVLDKDDCTVPLQTANARAYAVKNAKDGYADAQICLDDTGCPSPWGTATTCRPQPATTGIFHQVEVRTTTLNADHSTLVPPRLAQTLVGGTYKGTKVGACARVAWGVPASAKVLALTISKCDWERITGRGAKLGAVRAGAVRISDPLLSWCENIWDRASPSGYAWLTPSADATCRTTVAPGATTDLWMSTGPAGATRCAGAMNALVRSGEAVLVPIFDRVIAAIDPFPAAYRVAGFAAFVVTGTGPGSAVHGYFTKSVITERFPTTFGTFPDYGVQVIGRTG